MENNPKSKERQSMKFVPTSGYATVTLYDKKKHFGFASPNKMLQEAGIKENLFFHIAGYVQARARYRDEIIYELAEPPGDIENSLTNRSIFIPLVQQKEDGRYTARQWTISQFINPQISFVTETKKSELTLATVETVVFVGTDEECNEFIKRNQDFAKGELVKKGPVEDNPF